MVPGSKQRYRIQKRLLRKPLLVLQVQERRFSPYAMCGFVEWVDADIYDLQKLVCDQCAEPKQPLDDCQKPKLQTS